MASPGPSSSASASGVPAWVLLDRAPRLADLHPAGTGSEADVLLSFVPPPGVSTAVLDRALHPDAAAWGDTERCRVEGADESGRLLVAFPSPRAPGDSHLLVCRPVATSSSSGTAQGKARPIPSFPEALGLALSPAAPTGIISDARAKSGDGFFLAQLQSAPPSTPTSVALALCFCSDDEEWTVKPVPGDDRWGGFAAKRVVSHDRGLHGDAARLVFVDLSRGILLFHPRLAAASHFVELPAAAHDGGGGEVLATVDSSDGKIVYLAFFDVPEGTLVGLWSLCEDELRWDRSYGDLASDEVMQCDHRLLPLRPVRGIGPVDPNSLTRVFFVVGSVCFAVDVSPTGTFMARVRLVDMKPCNALESVLVSPLAEDRSKARSWMLNAKELGMGLVQRSRKNFHRVPRAFEFIGNTLNLPYTAPLVTAAQALDALNSSIGFSCDTPPQWHQYTTVATTQEAQRAIQVWKDSGRPAEMKVRAAPGVTPGQLEGLREVFARAGAERLIIESFDYVLVPRAPEF